MADEFNQSCINVIYKIMMYLYNNVFPVFAWTTLDNMDRANRKRKYKVRDGDALVQKFKYWQPFGLHF